MKKTIFIYLILLLPLFSQDVTHAKSMKLSYKGEKIVHALCDESKLPHLQGSMEQTIEKLKQSQACPSLSSDKLEAVAYYIGNGTVGTEQKHLHVPDGAKCPVCGMFVGKYPKWAASMMIEKKPYYFDGVKDMMKYYIFDGDFVYDRNMISQILVSDYYTLETIDAKEAYYVYDANVYGPMGRELIAFKTLQNAKIFSQEHKGKRVVRFNEITDTMVLTLDGLGQ